MSTFLFFFPPCPLLNHLLHTIDVLICDGPIEIRIEILHWIYCPCQTSAIGMIVSIYGLFWGRGANMFLCHVNALQCTGRGHAKECKFHIARPRMRIYFALSQACRLKERFLFPNSTEQNYSLPCQFRSRCQRIGLYGRKRPKKDTHVIYRNFTYCVHVRSISFLFRQW